MVQAAMLAEAPSLSAAAAGGPAEETQPSLLADMLLSPLQHPLATPQLRDRLAGLLLQVCCSLCCAECKGQPSVTSRDQLYLIVGHTLEAWPCYLHLLLRAVAAHGPPDACVQGLQPNRFLLQLRLSYAHSWSREIPSSTHGSGIWLH